MARIEIIMYIALGFATAGLIALLLGRLLWDLAVSIGRRRAQRTAPPAVAELQAERNQLRAEYAMLARRLEVRLDDLKMQLAEHMAEVSRSRNRIDRLGTEIEKRDASLAERNTEIARLREQLAALESELTTRTESLHKLQDEHHELDGARAVLSRELEAVRQQAGERDQQIARLSAEVDQLTVVSSEAASRERTVQERLRGRIEDLSALSRQIEAQRRQLLVQQSQSQALRDSMAERRQAEQGPGIVESDPAVDGTAGAALPAEAVRADGDHQHGAPLERRIEDAERQASELQKELDRLDRIWAAKLTEVARAVGSESAASDVGDDGLEPGPAAAEAEADAVVNGSASKPVAREGDGNEEVVEKKTLDETVPAEEDKKPASGLANVISLAQRIRALQRNGS